MESIQTRKFSKITNFESGKMYKVIDQSSQSIPLYLLNYFDINFVRNLDIIRKLIKQ